MKNFKYVMITSSLILGIIPSYVNARSNAHKTVFSDFSELLPKTSSQSGTDTTDSDFIDIDLDGDLDVFIAEGTAGFEGRANRLLLNDGSGLFVDISDQLPVQITPQNSLSADVGDFDLDGDMDIVVANLGATQLLANDGGGIFVDKSDLLPPPPVNILEDISSEVAFVDVNDDGRLDIFITNEIPPIPGVGPGGAQNFLYLQSLSGTFTDASLSHLPAALQQSIGFVAGDIDGDNDIDLIVSNVGEPEILINDGDGYFSVSTAYLPPQTSRAIALGDLNGDDAPDLVFANSNQEQNQVYLNNGAGVFSILEKALPMLADTSSDVKLVDIDFDGDLDVIFANSIPNEDFIGEGHPLAPALNPLYLNKGDGHFRKSKHYFPKTQAISFDIEIGDINGDGLDDIMFSNSDFGDLNETLFVRDRYSKGSKNRMHHKRMCIERVTR